VPSPSDSLSAVIVSGGKQFRVAPGDRILVDRLAAEPGSEITIDRVLLVADGDDLKVEAQALAGQTVTARVLRAVRGPKIDVLRYKSKKRVRVHRGARADLTALEILTIGGKQGERKAAAKKPAAKKPVAKKPVAKKPAAKKPAEKEPIEASARREAAPAAEVAGEAPATRTRRARAKAEPAEETQQDGA
jgi:large subunit ribosomal protein L21